MKVCIEKHPNGQVSLMTSLVNDDPDLNHEDDSGNPSDNPGDNPGENPG